MKTLQLSAIAFAAILLVACGSKKHQTQTTVLTLLSQRKHQTKVIRIHQIAMKVRMMQAIRQQMTFQPLVLKIRKEAVRQVPLTRIGIQYSTHIVNT